MGVRIIEEMEKKIKRLKVPKRFTIRPVLVHVNGVENAVLEQGYFDKMIDQLLS